MDKQQRTEHIGKLLFWFASFCSESEFSLHPYISPKIFFNLFFYLGIFTDKKILRCDNIAHNMVFNVSFVISVPPCVPSYHPRLTSSWSNVAQSKTYIIPELFLLLMTSLFTFRYHFLSFSCYWCRPVSYIYLTLPHIFLPFVTYILPNLTSYFTFRYLTLYLTLPYILPYLTLRFAFRCLTLSYVLPYLTISLTLHFALPYLTS